MKRAHSIHKFDICFLLDRLNINIYAVFLENPFSKHRKTKDTFKDELVGRGKELANSY